MSKAFTREDSDSEESPTFTKAESPRDARRLMTRDGADRLRKQLGTLIEQQQQLESSENIEQEIGQLRRIKEQMRVLEERLAVATIVSPLEVDPPDVRFGTFVTIRFSGGEDEEYRIVGADEADLEEDWISWLSPLAQALLGKSAGETIRFHAPSGEKMLEIVHISNRPR